VSSHTELVTRRFHTMSESWTGRARAKIDDCVEEKKLTASTKMDQREACSSETIALR
jgi:hypothetical protein